MEGRHLFAYSSRTETGRHVPLVALLALRDCVLLVNGTDSTKVAPAAAGVVASKDSVSLHRLPVLRSATENMPAVPCRRDEKRVGYD